MTKVATPNAHTVVLDLNRSYNPDFYTDDVLNKVPLLPQHAWDKTSVTGKVGNYDETRPERRRCRTSCRSRAAGMATFATNPLWQVVDGPWKLAQFHSDGYYAWVPNKNYSGPDKPVLPRYISPVHHRHRRDGHAALRDQPDRGPAAAQRRRPDSRAEARRLRGRRCPLPGVAEIVPNL